MDSISLELQALEASAQDEADWLMDGLQLLQDAGYFRASILKEHGGLEFSAREQLLAYQQVAAGSLSLALVLTQHDGACQFLQSTDNQAFAVEVLGALVRGEGIATIGISQLTTSHQDQPPVLVAAQDGSDFHVSGMIPWVTSAAHATWIVVGAAMDTPDTRQLLFCLPSSVPGVAIEAPQSLLALNGSWTSRIMCKEVHVPASTVLRGPVENVLARRSPVKSLTVSAVGMGMAERLIRRCEEADANGDFGAVLDKARQEFASLREELFRFGDIAAQDTVARKAETTTLRATINAHLVRLATTLMTLAKGRGYTSSHQAQRDVREALFFLVWSAPTQLRRETLAQVWR